MSRMLFPLHELPTELLDKVVQIAVLLCSENLLNLSDPVSEISRPFYNTALSLALVSFQIRSLTMRYFLHDVILSTPGDLKSFIGSLKLQAGHRRSNTRLHVDYSRYIKRFWCSYDLGQTPDQPADEYPDYDLLYPVIAHATSMGLGSEGFSLLYNRLAWLDVHAGVGPGNHNVLPFSCTRVTLAGFSWRWRPLTHSYHGQKFLEQITHLVLWFEEVNGSGDINGVPSWINTLPLSYMPNLTHLAIPLSMGRKGSVPKSPSKMLVYLRPPAIGLTTDFLTWATSSDPFRYGVVVDFPPTSLTNVEGQPCINWGGAFGVNGDHLIWSASAERKRA